MCSTIFFIASYNVIIKLAKNWHSLYKPRVFDSSMLVHLSNGITIAHLKKVFEDVLCEFLVLVGFQKGRVRFYDFFVGCAQIFSLLR